MVGNIIYTVNFIARFRAFVSITHTSRPLSLSLPTETLKKEEFHKVALSYSFGLLLNGCAISGSGSGSKMSSDGVSQVCAYACVCVRECMRVHVCVCPCGFM